MGAQQEAKIIKGIKRLGLDLSKMQFGKHILARLTAHPPDHEKPN